MSAKVSLARVSLMARTLTSYPATASAKPAFAFERFVESLRKAPSIPRKRPLSPTAAGQNSNTRRPILPTPLTTIQNGLSTSLDQVQHQGAAATAAEPSRQALAAENVELRNKVQSLESKVLSAESQGRVARNDPVLWRGAYEQLKKKVDDAHRMLA